MKLLLILCLAVLLVLLAACGESGGAGAREEGSSYQAPSEATSERVGALEVETLATGLDTPWEVAFAPDGRIFITERPGTIRVIEEGRLWEKPYAELPVEEIGEGGQLGLALDPNFEENDRLYAYYTTMEDGQLRNRLVRLVEEGGTARQEEILLEGPAASVHDGGRIAVGPDGKLYATLGDTSEGGLAQDRDALAGKIVRLNLDGSIPEDNPFPGSPVYSYGHRNPQGMAWDDEGNLYAPEHGPAARDEVNLIEPGANYGWPELSGEGGEPEYVDPILASGMDTWAPAGAEIVSGGPWDGNLLFTGLRGRSLHRVVLDPEDPSRVLSDEEVLEDEYGRLRTVEQGPDGTLYVLTSNRDGRGSAAAGDDRMLRITVPEDQTSS